MTRDRALVTAQNRRPETDRESRPATRGDARLATVRARALAYVLDAVFVLGALLAGTRDSPPRRRFRVLTVGTLVGATAYHVVLEGAAGRTVGKRLVGIAVVRPDGRPCGFRAATTRTLLRAVDWLPVGYLFGLAAIRRSDLRRRIGDRVADTVVVESE